MSVDNLIGIFIVFLGAFLIFIESINRNGKRSFGLRPIRGVQQLRRAIGLAVEEGRGIHLSLGKASLLNPANASALAGLSALERLTQTSMISDHPPVATSGEGSLSILSQDTMRAAYRNGNALEQFDPDAGIMTGSTSFSYISGTIPIIRDEKIYTNIFIGNFGPEVGLLTDAVNRQKSFSMSASDSLPAQSVLYATDQEPLIGEELFAVPAYLQASSMHRASLRTQDLMRWILIILLILGVVYKIFEALSGISLL